MKPLRQKLITAICFLLLLNVVTAQKETVTGTNFDLTNIPYIFEGEVIDFEIYPGDREGNRLPKGVYKLPDSSYAIPYVSAKVQVCKIYKGGAELKHGTIEIVTTGGGLQAYWYKDSLGNDVCSYAIMPPSHGTTEFLFRHGPGTKLVLFCTQAKYKGSSNRTFDNSFGIYPNRSIVYSTWNYEPTDPIAQGCGIFFATQTDIDNFLGQLGGLDMKAKNVCPKDGNGSLPEIKKDEIPVIDYQIRLNNYQAWLNFRQSFTPRPLDGNRDVNSTDLYLEMANSSLSGTSSTNAFLEFDILAYASVANTYFDNCLIRIQYSTAAFGMNVVANNNVTITRGPLFDNVTYTDPNMDVIDQTSNTMGIPMGSDFGQSSWNRTALEALPLLLMHIKIKIQNCGSFSGLNFTDITFTPIFSFYTVNANDNIVDGVPYGLTNYVGQIDDPMCIPVIDSYTDNISAGTGSTLSIGGNYFGNTMQANSTVVFKDANTGNLFPLQMGPKKGGIQYYDVISWADNSIVIRLPSIIDSVPDGANNQTFPIPGSGKFKVVNLTSNSALSFDPLTIPYGSSQFIPPGTYQKANIELSNLNSSGGYTLYCNPAVEATLPGAKAIIAKALRDWSCASGVNITLGPDLNLGTAVDNVCMVNLYTSTDSSAQRTNKAKIDCIGSPTTFYLASFDIEIAYPLPFSLNWQIDSTGNKFAGYLDFYHAVAHELGHAHMQIHVNDSIGDLMFWEITSLPYSSSQRKRVWSSPNAMQGSDWMMANLITPDCFINHVLFFPSDCTGIGIEETSEAGIFINTYPNPVSDGYVTVNFTLLAEARTRFILYSELGQMLSATQELKNIGNMTEMIYLGDLANGTYYLQVLINDVPHTVKVIKN